MYNSNFLCTYQLLKEPDLSDDLYRCQFLQACNINTWDGETIHKVIQYLEQLTKQDTTFYNQLKLSNMDNSFILLLAYPYFYLTHRCICDIIQHGKVTDEHCNSLFNQIVKNNN
jgi:hypothetical protein